MDVPELRTCVYRLFLLRGFKFRSLIASQAQKLDPSVFLAIHVSDKNSSPSSQSKSLYRPNIIDYSTYK